MTKTPHLLKRFFILTILQRSFIYNHEQTITRRKVEKMNGRIRGYACLADYHEKTMEMLLKLNVVEYVDAPNGISCTCQTTEQLQESINKLYEEKQVNLLQYDDVILSLANEQKIELEKNLFEDMTSLLTLIIQYGSNCEIWIRWNRRLGFKKKNN